MSAVPHQIILASAGSGKTYALSNRIIRLLALGVDPTRIVAVTFTRKAAAEFVHAVLGKLATAALDGGYARQLSEEIGVRVGIDDFRSLLARTVSVLDRLPFGTLDGFFQRIAMSCALEIGLPGQFEILDPVREQIVQERVLRSLFRSRAGNASARRAMLEAFREMTSGRDEKDLAGIVRQFVLSVHTLYLAGPGEHLWGNCSTIWPDGCGWLPPALIDDVAGHFKAITESGTEQFAKSLTKLVDQAVNWTPGKTIEVGALLQAAIQQYHELEAGTATISFSRRAYPFEAQAAQALARIVHRYIGGSIEQGERIARGVYQILRMYEEGYDREVRRLGLLTFSDVTEMLRRSTNIDWEFRLDSRLSHWLFDEFQDTSVAQWCVVRNLVEEALQDTSGERSVFFVGDPKQAIYRWRGGEHKLLDGIRRRFGQVLERVDLDRSYRSTSPVVELINRAGETASTLDGLPASVAAEWSEGWRKHESAHPDRCGFATVIPLSAKAKSDELAEAIREILVDVDPISKGLTCAILVRTNNEVREISRSLREGGFLSIAADAIESVMVDNPITGSLAQLFAAVAHPRDTAARGFAEMSPLGDLVSAQAGWPGLRRSLLTRIAASGFEATSNWIWDQVPSNHPADPFSRRRFAQWLDAARSFDATGNRDIDEFLQFMRTQTFRDESAVGRVQVMTIHRSKGLGFDMVIVPMMDSTRMDGLPQGVFLIPRDDDHLPKWVLGRPNEDICKIVPELCQAFDDLRSESAYEALCTWYVALTRAKRALYVLAPDQIPNKMSSPAGWIWEAVRDSGDSPPAAWSTGNTDWFDKLSPSPPVVRPRPPKAQWSSFQSVRRLRAIRPSDAESGSPIVLHTQPRRLGLEVHRAFAGIAWLDDQDPAKILASSGIGQNAIQEVLTALANPEVAALFKRPRESVELWRERAFDLVDAGSWISGVFDRVVLGSDFAHLIEFKSDRSEPTATEARHRSQIHRYRKALATMTHFPLERIVATLVLSAVPCVIRIDP